MIDQLNTIGNYYWKSKSKKVQESYLSSCLIMVVFVKNWSPWVLIWSNISRFEYPIVQRSYYNPWSDLTFLCFSIPHLSVSGSSPPHVRQSVSPGPNVKSEPMSPRHPGDPGAMTRGHQAPSHLSPASLNTGERWRQITLERAGEWY